MESGDIVVISMLKHEDVAPSVWSRTRSRSCCCDETLIPVCRFVVSRLRRHTKAGLVSRHDSEVNLWFTEALLVLLYVSLTGILIVISCRFVCKVLKVPIWRLCGALGTFSNDLLHTAKFNKKNVFAASPRSAQSLKALSPFLLFIFLCFIDPSFAAVLISTSLWNFSLSLMSFAPSFSPLASALSELPGPFIEWFGVRRGDIISHNASLLPRLWGRMETDGAETKPTISPRKALIRSLWPITLHCSPS